jgi:hypothetical protein
LDPVAPGIEEVEPGAGEGFDTMRVERGSGSGLVVDDQSEMSGLV